jgi:5'-phosphate synthase pdxT subunit
LKQRITVGIIALQGDFAAHQKALSRAGARTWPVRHPEELAQADAAVIPGGESTTMTLLGYENGLWQALKERALSGMPVMGTCAGIIMLARELVGESARVHPLGLLDIAVARNAFGSQVDSFEDSVEVRLAGVALTVPGVFIRAPAITQVGGDARVLGTRRGEPVMVQQGKVLGLSFHPELTADRSIVEYFLSLAG